MSIDNIRSETRREPGPASDHRSLSLRQAQSSALHTPGFTLGGSSSASLPPKVSEQILSIDTSSFMNQQELIYKYLGRADYQLTHHRMREFTSDRNEHTGDEIWVCEHPPVFTQGQAGKAEHLLDAGDIPVVQSDRGGQVTYHGPGQLVVYPLLDLRRLQLNVRAYVSLLENTVVRFLDYYGVMAAPKPEAPGVYVENAKIASLGIRVRKGCCFHGVAVNINMDLSPFSRINPCGYPQLKMVQLKDFVDEAALPNMQQAGEQFVALLAEELNVRVIPG